MYCTRIFQKLNRREYHLIGEPLKLINQHRLPTNYYQRLKLHNAPTNDSLISYLRVITSYKPSTLSFFRLNEIRQSVKSIHNVFIIFSLFLNEGTHNATCYNFFYIPYIGVNLSTAEKVQESAPFFKIHPGIKNTICTSITCYIIKPYWHWLSIYELIHTEVG